MSPEDHPGSVAAGSLTASSAPAHEIEPEVGTSSAENQAPAAAEASIEDSVAATEEIRAAETGGAAPAAAEPSSTADAAPADADSGEVSLETAYAAEMMTGMPEVPGLAPGEIRRGTVVKVTDAEVMVDIGLKSEGAIPREEFLSPDGELTVQPGDVVDVLFEDFEEQEGTFKVSHRKAANIRVWEELETSSRSGSPVKGRVTERTKGGLTVSLGGVRAFMPSSQADLRPLRNLDSLIGQDIECKVIKFNRARNNVVVSRKAALEEVTARLKAELAATLAEGAEVTGVVKNLTTYGAFIDLGGMDGLLHVTDLAWGRVGHPSEVVKVGQELRLKVLKYDREKERISLGLKQLLPDPWERVMLNYPPGTRLNGRVVSLTDYGAFCEIEPGIEGLIHVSEMTWSRRLKHPSKFVNVGDEIEISVLDIHPEQRRISLSLRQALGDPWSTLAERLSPGARVEGRVRNLTDYGAFVEIEDGIEGLIHVSDMSWTKSPKHPSEVLKKGQKVEAVVLSVDVHQRRVSLGLKQLQPDAWQSFFDETPVGTVLTGKVVRLAQFGAFVELREGIEGLCHISEMGDEHGRGGRTPLQVGMELPFRVIKVSREERKAGLSLKSSEPPKEEPAAHRPRQKAQEAPAPAASTTMGEKMAQAIRAAAVRGARATAKPGNPPAAAQTAAAPLEAPEAAAADISHGQDVSVSGSLTPASSEPVETVHSHPGSEGKNGFASRTDGSALGERVAVVAADSTNAATRGEDGTMPSAVHEAAPSGATATDTSKEAGTDASPEALSVVAQS